jgi:hypothetical protein
MTAEQLGLTDLQHDTLIKVLGLLERRELNEIKGEVRGDDVDPLGFSMRSWLTCICGWTNRLTADRAFPRFHHGPDAYGQLGTLFNKTALNMDQATAALRDYLTTGEVKR